MKKVMMRLLAELLRDSKKSDRELAKVSGSFSANCQQNKK